MTVKRPKPWVRGPLELIRHAEEHLGGSSDFDRRMALISFDNAIELSIVTFLSLNPLQRNGWTCERAQLSTWLHNFHTKLEFLEHYVVSHLGQEMQVGRDELIFFHKVRNELYHNGNGVAPNLDIVEDIRVASNWVFLSLFGNHPSEHGSFNKYEAEGVNEEAPEDFSSSTQVLKAVLDMKKMLTSYLDGVGDAHGSLISSIDTLVEKIPIKLSDSLMAVAREAEAVRETILGGEEPNSSSEELRALSFELKKHSEKIDSKLRAYQVELVDAAINATLDSMPPNEKRKAGHVHQVMGSGRGMSIISYILRARQIKGLQLIPFIVVSMYRVELEQLKERLRNHAPECAGLRLRTPKNSRELRQTLLDEQDVVVFATLGLLRRSIPCYEGRCLLIGVDMERLEFDISRVVPDATLINFGSGPLLGKQAVGGNFDAVIASFDFASAVEQGFFQPLVLSRPEGVAIDRIEEKGDSVDITKAIVRSVSEVVESHRYGLCRIVVVVNKISEAFRLLNSLECSLGLLGDKKMSSMVLGMASSAVEDQGRDAVRMFNDESNSIAILIVTSGSLIGLDLFNPQLAYVASPLSAESQYILASLLGRSQGLHSKKIIDFGSNLWSSLV